MKATINTVHVTKVKNHSSHAKLKLIKIKHVEPKPAVRKTNDMSVVAGIAIVVVAPGPLKLLGIPLILGGCAAPPTPTPKPSAEPTQMPYQFPIKPFEGDDDATASASIFTIVGTNSFSPNASKPHSYLSIFDNKWGFIRDGRDTGDLWSQAFIDTVPQEGQDGLNLYLYEKITPTAPESPAPAPPTQENMTEDITAYKVAIEKVSKNVSEPKGIIITSTTTGNITSMLKASADGQLYAVMLEKDGNLNKASVTEYKKAPISDPDNYKIIKDNSEIEWDADQSKYLILEKEQPNTSNTKMVFIARNRASGELFSGIKDPKTGKITALYKYSREK